MSDKIYLKEITLPIVETGENETYSFVQTDDDLDTAGDAADAKAVGDELTNLKQDYNSLSESKADKTDNNPSMGAGYASQLVSSLRKSDSMPYNFRKVPYDSTLEDGSIVGVSMPINQLVANGNFASQTGWGAQNGATINSVSDNVLDVSFSADAQSQVYKGIILTSGHVILSMIDVKMPDATNQITYTGGALTNTALTAKTTNWQNVYVMFKQTYSYILIRNTSGNAIANVKLRNCMAFDLTLMLGSAIAEYVYGLEIATAGAGVAWLKEHFPKQFDSGYQAYNAGEIKSISGLAEHKSVGFNAWDEVWEYTTRNGMTSIWTKNYVPVMPSTEYCITLQSSIYSIKVNQYDQNYTLVDSSDHSLSNHKYMLTTRSDCAYIMIGFNGNYGDTYNHDICINISKTTGTPKNGDYVPYESHTYALDSTKTLRGILKLDSNNKLYADGDVYKADGTVERRYGVVDLGTLDWVYVSSGSVFAPYFYVPIPNMKQPTNIQTAAFDIICDKYVTTPRAQGTFVSGCICADVSGSTPQIQIIDTTYTSSSAFKTAMSGVKLIYPLATPTTETAEPYGNPQVINPDGTESYVYESGSFELPVGHTSEYPVNVSGQLDDILDTPTTNGTYTLQATVADGKVSYEWVSA